MICLTKFVGTAASADLVSGVVMVGQSSNSEFAAARCPSGGIRLRRHSQIRMRIFKNQWVAKKKADGIPSAFFFRIG
jgi:regulatory protein YycH of two-component signal transduction system YycFG